jgi:hypothetical protein
MKKTIIGFILAIVVTFGFYSFDGNAQMGSGMMGQGGGMGQGGMMGRGYGPGPGYGMSQGGMGRGYGMQPGMTDQGYGRGPGYGHGTQYQQTQKPLKEKDVKPRIENYLKSTRNPNLKMGKVEDKGSTFEAEIVTRDNSLVDKIAIDKTTGAMRSVY